MRFFHTHLPFKLFLSAAFFALNLLSSQAFSAPASQTVQITDGWVRETNPGQAVGAAYMTITSKDDAELVAIESAITTNIEIHHMQIDKGVMKMRMLETLPLPANQAVKLAPGGLHIMLFDLKAPLKAGQTIPLTLHFNKVVKGQPSKARFAQSVVLSVKSLEDGTSHNTHHNHEHHNH